MAGVRDGRGLPKRKGRGGQGERGEEHSECTVFLTRRVVSRVLLGITAPDNVEARVEVLEQYSLENGFGGHYSGRNVTGLAGTGC